MQLNSFNALRAEMFGYVLTRTDKTILHRSSPETHNETRFSGRYGHISISSTLRDRAKCARFKMIGYSHEAYWDTDDIPMTDEQEDRAWAKACEMADMPVDWYEKAKALIGPNAVYYGPNAVPYDLWGQIAHLSKWHIWKPSWKKTWCSRTCNDVILAGRGDILLPYLWSLRREIRPDQLAWLVRHYFRKGE